MRINMRITIAVLLCALVVGAATTSASATTQGSDACELMERTSFDYVQSHIWYANLSEHHGRGSYSCQWRDATKLNEHGLSLYVFVTRSARDAASQFQQQYAPATFGPRIRLPGADEARGKEFTTRIATRRFTESRVAWRQGRYVGLLSVLGVGLSGDLEVALDLLKPFVRRLARQGVNP